MAHALCGYVGALAAGADRDRDRVPVAMALVLPALLARALSEGGGVYGETSGRLLELASADQVAFRGVVGGMGEGQRGFLEEVIRSGREAAAAGRGVESAGGGKSEPSIALKMDFGG